MHTSDFRYHSDLSGAFDVHLYQRLVSPFTRAPQFHCHPEFELALFRAGTGIYHVGSQRYPIESGDVFLFASNEPHYITRIDAQEKMLILNFHFTRNFVCAPMMDSFDRRYLSLFLNRNANFRNRLSGSEPIAKRIGQSLLEFEELFAGAGVEALPKVKARLLLVLAELAEEPDFKPNEEAAATAQSIDKIEHAANYIQDHLTQAITLEDIAQEAGISRAYFSTLFKRTYGITLWEYIVAKRVQYAITLLGNHEMTILDVALQSGFNNTANFNRAFRRLTGRTPTAYQKETLRVPD